MTFTPIGESDLEKPNIKAGLHNIVKITSEQKKHLDNPEIILKTDKPDLLKQKLSIKNNKKVVRKKEIVKKIYDPKQLQDPKERKKKNLVKVFYSPEELQIPVEYVIEKGNIILLHKPGEIKNIQERQNLKDPAKTRKHESEKKQPQINKVPLQRHLPEHKKTTDNIQKLDKDGHWNEFDENQHLKRTGQSILSAEGEKYNLKENFFAVNDNHKLLNKLFVESTVASDIDLKAIDVKKNVGKDDRGLVSFIGENHKKDHVKNIDNLVKDIENNKIGYNTAICMERKNYGNNLGVSDVILIANVLEHNEKNPQKEINIPDKIKNNSLIYHDAVLYKTAKENGVKVIGLEGKNLRVDKDHKDYNKVREEYMAARINHVTSKGYDVIAHVGSSHVEPLKQMTKDNQVADQLPLYLRRRLSKEGVKKFNEIKAILDSEKTKKTATEPKVIVGKGKNTRDNGGRSI